MVNSPWYFFLPTRKTTTNVAEGISKLCLVEYAHKIISRNDVLVNIDRNEIVFFFTFRLYLNGDGMGRGTHVSFFFVVMKGEYDALLQWPFSERVAFRLINPYNKDESIQESFIPGRCLIWYLLLLYKNEYYSKKRDQYSRTVDNFFFMGWRMMKFFP